MELVSFFVFLFWKRQPTSNIKSPEPVKLMANTPPENIKQETRSKAGQEPFRLDTITSQSEVDPSDSEVDTDDILRHIPMHRVGKSLLDC